MENKIHFLQEEIVQYNDLLYIRNTLLHETCQIPVEKVNGIANAFQLKKTIYGKNIKIGEYIWFEYDHLPPKIRNSKLFPSKLALIEILHKNKADFNKESNCLYQYELILLNIAAENSEIFLPKFKDYKISKNKISSYCKTFAIFDLLLQFKHLKIHEKFNLFRAVVDSSFSSQSVSMDHFYEKYNGIVKYGIINCITHKGYSNKNASKITKLHQDIIGHFYRKGSKLSRNDILQNVNKVLEIKNLKPISLTSVKRVLLNNYNKNLDDMVRNGESWYKNTILPFLVRSEPENSGDHYQIDATKLQIYCKEGKREGAFLWIAVVIDGHSKQIMGFAIADKESPNLYTKALKSAFSRTNSLPAEILRDNYLGYTHDNELSDLIKQTELLGVIWRAHKVGNPRDKGIIESFNNVFNTIFCKKIPGYIGEGIKSRNINARPNPEHLAFLRKNKLLKNIDEIILCVTESIHNYNMSGTGNKNATPLEKYQLRPPKNTIELDRVKETLIYYKSKTVKILRSTICINVNGYSSFYHILNPELILELNNSVVQIRYNPLDLSIIYLFTEKESRYITDLKIVEPIPLAKVNQTVDDLSNLNNYFHQNKLLLKELQAKIEERQAAIEALELPPFVLEPGFQGDLEIYNSKKIVSALEIDYHNSIQLPLKNDLKKEKVFSKYKSVYNEIQTLLYKQKGSIKKL